MTLSSHHKTSHRVSLKRNNKILTLLLILSLFFLALFFIIKPICASFSEKYIARGDNFLMQKKYLSADLEYEKAFSLIQNQKAIDRRELTKKCARNILEMKDLLSEKNNIALLNLFAEANTVPKVESEAVKKSKELIEKNEYQLAIIPALTAIEMDQNYRDAWLYLGIANLKSAQYLELKQDDRDYYLSNAKNALNKAKEIDPQYIPIQNYLDMAGKI